MMSRIKLIVVNENILGALHPNQVYDVLHASVLKGAPFMAVPEPRIIFSNDTVRLASEKDFEEFRCVFGSFSNREIYEYV